MQVSKTNLIKWLFAKNVFNIIPKNNNINLNVYKAVHISITVSK